MATMKYPNVAGGTNMPVVTNNGHPHHVDHEVDSLFTSSCWQNSNMTLHNDFIETHSLTLDNNLGADKLLLDSPIRDENEMETDALDKLFLSSQPNAANLAELKPLPPFTGYTANLSINGIQGHHYHTISQRIPEENNNTYNSYNEQNIVSSSTCNVSAEADSKTSLYDSSGYADSASAKLYEECAGADSAVTHIKTEIGEYDISIDFANIIGSAIADTTVPNNPDSEDPTGSRDSWMDFDALIDNACVVDQHQKGMEGMEQFVLPCTNSQDYPSKSLQNSGGSTLQTLLTHGYMPLLQNRLQNGPPIKQETPSSTNFGDITTSSPPANVVSTTDNLMLTVNGRYMPQYGVHGLDADHRNLRSPDMLGQNYPHTTTTSTPNATKKSRSRAQKKQQASSTVFQAEQSLGLLGKEKTVHRCSICNRGFLNKSNIKVHLRTHTGEKPFRCDTCAKAFRQKAHLLKHQQIHKRIGRD